MCHISRSRILRVNAKSSVVRYADTPPKRFLIKKKRKGNVTIAKKMGRALIAKIFIPNKESGKKTR